MTPKPIIYSHHAKKQLKKRGIRRTEVRWLFAKGLRSMGETAFEIRGYLGSHEASLICSEDATRIIVITVMWLGGD